MYVQYAVRNTKKVTIKSACRNQRNLYKGDDFFFLKDKICSSGKIFEP